MDIKLHLHLFGLSQFCNMWGPLLTVFSSPPKAVPWYSCFKVFLYAAELFFCGQMNGSSWLWPTSCLAACLAPGWGIRFPLNSTERTEGVNPSFFPFIHSSLAEGMIQLTQPRTLQPSMELSQLDAVSLHW